MNSAFVSVQGLCKNYNGTAAVNQLSFSIGQGDSFGLLGPNGAGKTTTISMLSGLFKPDAGTIHIGNFNMATHPRQAKALMGIVPQEIALYPTLNARENLHFWGSLYGLRGTGLKKRIETVLDLIGLRDRAREPVQNFSGGMKRRLNIGIGLLHNPQLLLLDEPTVGVDPQSRRNILDTIKTLNEEGMTVIYTSHYMEEVEELCPIVLIIDHGKVVAAGTQQQLRDLVGDTDLIRLNTDQSLEDTAPLQQIQGVGEVTVSDQSVQITVSDSNQSLAAIISAITDQGLKVTAVQIEKPNLEAVFLHHTGRSLRD